MANNGNTIMIPVGKKRKKRAASNTSEAGKAMEEDAEEVKKTLKNIHKFINFQGFETQLGPLVDQLMPHTTFHCSLSQ